MVKVNKHTVQVISVVCLTAISCTALVRGIDGVLLASICGLIGGIAGYSVGKANSSS